MAAGLAILLTGSMAAWADSDLTKQVVAEFENAAEYDRQLCATAQRMLVNADQGLVSDAFSIFLERAPGGVFDTEQMDIDPDTGIINVAMATVTVTVDGESLATHVACKMVNRERVNDVLQLQLTGPTRSCRDINERTYRIALALLYPEDRRRYEATGRRLSFVDDYVATAGGEWLPSVVNDFIRPDNAEDGPGHLVIQAPSVQVPWDPVSRDWFKGTHHCKLITLSTMQRWMTGGALTGASEMFPRSKPPCIEPAATSSTAGSCVFYFGPAGSDFCQDFSGPAWTSESAKAACGGRHATRSDWIAAERRYAGDGGLYSPSSCAARKLDADKLHGTCVFHCNEPDEALWHIVGPATGEHQVEGIERACDLFVPAGLH